MDGFDGSRESLHGFCSCSCVQTLCVTRAINFVVTHNILWRTCRIGELYNYDVYICIVVIHDIRVSFPVMLKYYTIIHI